MAAMLELVRKQDQTNQHPSRKKRWSYSQGSAGQEADVEMPSFCMIEVVNVSC